MTFDLDPKRMQAILDKNLATSYGLTLVVGLPFPMPVLEQVAQLREQIETLLPGRIIWYEPHHLHATLLAPLRGRYREGPPLQRSELPADIDGLVDALNCCFRALSPFVLRLDGLHLAPDGRLLSLGSDPDQVRQQVAGRLASFPGLDRPKELDDWHITLGYLQTPAPLIDETEQIGFEAGRTMFRSGPLGALTADRVWLVHYADRTLSRVVGKASLLLGRSNGLTADSLLRDLGIGQD